MQTTSGLRELDTYLLSVLGKEARRRLTSQGVLLRHHAILALLAERGPCAQRDLCDALAIDPSDMVKALDELQSLDHLRRDRDPADRRRHLVSLTPAGTRALKAMTRTAALSADALLAPLSAPQRTTLRQLLQLALDALPPAATP